MVTLDTDRDGDTTHVSVVETTMQMTFELDISKRPDERYVSRPLMLTHFLSADKHRAVSGRLYELCSLPYRISNLSVFQLGRVQKKLGAIQRANDENSGTI